jgi:hypothetical protein
VQNRPVTARVLLCTRRNHIVRWGWGSVSQDGAVQGDNGVGCGAATVQQYLRAGLIDEMHVVIVPILLGSGERLLDHLDGGPDGYECVELVSSPSVAHVRLRRHDESGQQPRPLAG